MQIAARWTWGVLISVMCVFVPYASAQEGASTLEVVGKARVMVDPNAATLSFAVETAAATARKAVADNAARSQAVISALKKLLGPGDTVQTANYNLSPVYPRGERIRPEGYRVLNWVTVKTKKLDQVGEYIDAAVQAGASNIGNLQFHNDRQEEYRLEAAKMAVKNAIADANQLAATADRIIRRILKISYTPAEHFPRMMRAEASPAGFGTPIEPGQYPVESSVRLVFELQ